MHKLAKGKTEELPEVSATPVNTLVEEDDDNMDPAEENDQ